MTFRAIFPIAGLCFAVALGAAIAPQTMSAQTHFDSAGRATATDPFEDDGFRPVWQQQQQKARQAAAAKAKENEKLAQAPKAKGAAPAAAPKADPKAEATPSVRTETTTFDRWIVTCREVPGKQPKACSAALRVVQQNQQLIILWEIGRGNDGVVRSVVQTPTGVFVQKGVDMKVGDAVVGKLDYVACVPQNCEANGVLDDALGKKIGGAEEVTFTIHAKDGRDVNFKFPVKGFDKALAAVRS